MELKKIKIEDIKPYERNPRFNDDAVDAVMKSIEQCEYIAPIVLDENNVILAGHTRYKALKKLGYKEAECVIKEGLTEEQKKKYRLLDNKTNELADWDMDLLAQELDGLDFGDLDLDWGEVSENVSKKYDSAISGALKEKFIMPPFSVLDARQGDWRKRKKEWLKIIESDKGRANNLIGEGLNRLAINTDANLSGTSVFDPVLCEIMYHWFSKRKDKIIDPFAGGSVRGIVCQMMDRQYFGNDLRKEQITENYLK